MPPRRKYARKARKPRRKVMRRKIARGLAPVNTACIRENSQLSQDDGSVVLYRSLALDDATYDRAQATAKAFQEFRIKSVKLTFQPFADTFTPAAGNTIPQLYFQLDRGAAMDTSAQFQTFLDMGVKPIRFDDKNITRKWKPAVLVTNAVAVGTNTSTQLKTSPWLSTNGNAINNALPWIPNSTDHYGAAFYVTKMNPLTPTVKYKIDIEVIFEFRKPLWSTRGASQMADPVILM